MRMLYCPLRSPTNASKRLPGKTAKSFSAVAASNRSSFNLAARSIPEKAFTRFPAAKSRVRLSRYPTIIYQSILSLGVTSSVMKCLCACEYAANGSLKGVGGPNRIAATSGTRYKEDSNMEYQWGRFVWWLGQNSAAVQALAAVATVVLTCVLILVTRRYVLLTQKILEAGEASICALFLPDINAGIEFTHPRRAELSVWVENVGESPIRLSRAKLIGGSIFRWTDPPNQENPFASETKFGARSELTGLTSLFLRKNGKGSGVVRIVPTQQIGESEWLNLLDYRISLTASAIIEVSDITGRIFYSFTVLRDAHASTTRIEARTPSRFDSV